MPDPVPSPALSRRTVVVGGAAALGAAGLVVAGCGTASPGGGSGAAAAAGATLGPTSDVPVGSAKIFTTAAVVVTQPTAGSFEGFSTVCPHQGCAVASVEGADIVCPCHGSMFGLDGNVKSGPAQTGLAKRAVTVTGDQITVA